MTARIANKKEIEKTSKTAIQFFYPVYCPLLRNIHGPKAQGSVKAKQNMDLGGL